MPVDVVLVDDVLPPPSTCGGSGSAKSRFFLADTASTSQRQ